MEAVYDETRIASDRVEQNQQTLVIQTGLMEAISRAITGLVSGQQGNCLLPLVHRARQGNITIADALTQTQQVSCSIPPQIEREQPVLFEDAHGRLTPFHVEFINSYAAFQALLQARFENMPGLGKVKGLEYSMQDTHSKRILDLSRPWESNMRPGRKFAMSMVSQLTKAVRSSCPACSRETSNPNEEGSDVQCDNPDCRMIFRCITQSDHPILGKRKRSESSGSPTKRTKRGQSEDVTDQDDADGIHEFRRVPIIQRLPQTPWETSVSGDRYPYTRMPTSFSPKQISVPSMSSVSSSFDGGDMHAMPSPRHESISGHGSNDQRGREIPLLTITDTARKDHTTGISSIENSDIQSSTMDSIAKIPPIIVSMRQRKEPSVS